MSHIPFDGAQNRIYRTLGPPGCGKTSWLVRQALRAAERFGIDGVRVVSMTRAAAREFARPDRRSTIPPENITTLHSLAYLSIGRPKVVSAKDLHRFAEESRYEITTGDGTDDDRMSISTRRSGQTSGDALMALDALHRACMTVSPNAGDRLFSERWREWKRENDLIDFTDMLEMALATTDYAPGRPSALLVDEAQDLSALELALIEKWGLRCSVVVLCGDPDQSIYTWRGATRDALLPPGIAPFHVLPQSYRVPRAVQARALSIIEMSSTRSGAVYLPKEDHEGSVGVAGSFLRPSTILDHLETETLSDPFSGDVMLLAPCAYMLGGIVKGLRERGIGYCNPYCNEWNPLRSGDSAAARGAVSTTTGADRVIAMSRLKTPRDWRIVLLGLKNERNGGPLRYGMKSYIETLSDDSPPERIMRVLSEVMLPGGYELIDHAPSINGGPVGVVERLIAVSTEEVKTSTAFPLAVYRRDGLLGLENPRVIVGTIHSVKGGEAETVYLSSLLSPKGWEQLDVPGWDGEDAIWRMFYVGATRAKERLILCDGNDEIDDKKFGTRGVSL